jgi:hypothetical protein
MDHLALPAPPQHIAWEDTLIFCAHVKTNDSTERPSAKFRMGDIHAMKAALQTLLETIRGVDDDEDGFVSTKIYILLSDARDQFAFIRSENPSTLRQMLRLSRARRDLDKVLELLQQELPKYRKAQQINEKDIARIQSAANLLVVRDQ